MQTKRIAAALFASALTLTATAGDLPQPAPNAGLASVIIDDQSGDELARDHGIEPLIVPDLLELIKAVLEANRPATLMHLPVDEDSTDNPVGRLTFAPFAGGSPPHAPSPTLPLRVLTAETAKYQRDRAGWQQRIKLYQQKVVADAEGFVRQVTATQFEISERFDAKLAERNGHDYSRSDIVGCISCANRMLGPSGRRVLILNSDCVDAPANRPPRTTPLTNTELAEKVELIFVNTSRLPQQSPLFRGLPNKTHEVESMKAACALLAQMLGLPPVAGTAKSDERVVPAR
jgi:hypothetical protein